MTDDQANHKPPANEPTAMAPATGNLDGPVPQPDEPAVPGDEPPIAWPTAEDDEPTFTQPNPPAEPILDEPTLAEASPTDEPTIATPAIPGDEAAPEPANSHDESTLAQASPTDQPTLATPAPPGDEATTRPAADDEEPTPAVPDDRRPDEPTARPTTGHDEPTLAHASPTDQPTLATPAPPGDEAAPEPANSHDKRTLAQASPTDQPTLTTPTTPGGEATTRPAPDDEEPTLAQASSTDEPTIATPAIPGDEATITGPATSHDEPTHATPANPSDEATIAGPVVGDDEATLAEPAISDDEPTLAVGTDDPTTTGPTVGSWPFDQFEPAPPEELVWRVEAPPVRPAVHRPAYYLVLGAAVVLVVGLVALAAVVTVVRPRQEIAGSAGGLGVPEITTSSVAPPAPTSSTVAGAFAELAAHPLSNSTARMPDVTCSLPRFDPADDRQADFYAAAKVCADAAWRPLLAGAGLDGEVTVVTLTGPAETRSCGDLAPDSPPTQCAGTVYLTPAYLRDTERNGRYPGRYLGVFLREYARALQFTTGVEELVAALNTGSAADIDTRVEQQATCLAGVVAGSMSGRGAIDSNITTEIRDRLSTMDAPPDVKAWLDKGFQRRTPAACNSWAA